jgi:hypothetical protein
MDARRKIAIASTVVFGGVFVARVAHPQSADVPIQMSVSDTVRSMRLPHEALPAGVPADYSWRSSPVIQAGNRVPPTYRAMTGWGQVFLASGARPAHASISFRNFRTYLLLQSGELRLVQSTNTIEGANFNPDYRHNISRPASLNTASDVETVVATDPGYAFHFWPKAGRVDMDPAAVRGVIVALEARVSPTNGQAAADVRRKYILSMGADYWTTRTSAWDDYKTNAGVAIGRFQYVTNDWRCFTMTTLTEQDTRMLGKSFAC